MMTTTRRAFRTLTFAFTCLLAWTLTACGGGGSSDAGPAASALTLTGTAATGALVAGRPVEAKCATGTASGTTNADGSYALSVSAGVWPCIARVTLATGGTLHTVFAGTGTSATANITPVTQLIVASLLAADPAAYYLGFSNTTAAQLVAGAVAAAQVRVVALLLASGIDLAPAGDLISGALVAANAYDRALDALAAALTRSATTLDTLTTAVINQATPSVASLPSDLLLQPATSTCAAMRSATYRLVTPTSGSTIANQTSASVFNASTMTITRADGSTGTWVANGACRFTDQGSGYSADVVVSQAGVLVGRFTRDNGATYHDFIGFPEQAHTLAELAGTWNALGVNRASTAFVGAAGAVTFDTAGKLTAGSNCQNNTTWAIDVCINVSDVLLNLIPPFVADGSGGFDLIDTGTGAVGSRLFGYKAGSGDLMWVAVVNNGGFALYAPNKSVPLPVVGALGANWNLDVSAQLVPIPGIYETSSTVTAVNAAAGSWTRTQRSLGRYADRTETLFANNPRSGYAHRPAGTVTASDGTVVQISEFTSLRMHGMGFGPLLLPSPKLFEFFVAKP